MKINLITLGCPKNIVDSEILLGGLKGEDVEIVENPLEAETIILNTCGFIQGAKEESIDAILEAVEYKKRGDCQKVFVTGCLSERYRQELIDEIPEVDGYFGNRDMTRILKQLLQKLDLKRELLGERHLTTPRHFAYLKISEGCENPCTFCSIPGIRGNFKSRSMESLLDEAQLLAGNGVQELIIIAQDSTIYGMDLYGEKKLVPLLEKLTALKLFRWIRLLYTYPAHFSEDLIEIITDKQDVINYIDMPIQHISDRLLRRMARKVRRKDIEKIIDKLRANNPDLALRTSLIVGFPGETDSEYEELCGFIESTRFQRLGLFTYSKEEDTPAYHFSNQIPEYIKNERLAELCDLQNQISFELNQELVGSKKRILIDKYDEEANAYVGRTSWDCPEIDSIVLLKDRAKVQTGNFYDVEITGCAEYELYAEMADHAATTIPSQATISRGLL